MNNGGQDPRGDRGAAANGGRHGLSGMDMEMEEYDDEMDMNGQDDYGSQYDQGMATTGGLGVPGGYDV